MTFYLGTHLPHWLGTATVPLFVSRRRLARIRRHLRAQAPWALDSGGFSELKEEGRWTIPPTVYAAEAIAWAEEIGPPDFAAVQDWMCEPLILAKTGETIAEHQARTIDSFLELTALAPGIRWAPVLQGWHPADYQAHAAAYEAAGVDLVAAPTVGVGTLCRRQGSEECAQIIAGLAPLGFRLHAFGLKSAGLALSAHQLTSADSMAWSFNARRNPPLEGCSHKSCANCLIYALLWRKRLLAATSMGRESRRQLTFSGF